ncbi:MAG: UDP-N-acetyl-D-glucosamine dehydrogenase [Gaiellales bacterium]|jgi:UDP-N-acetyl-D-glucosamine dehydrogenase|nr:UDP-N-acetyl-D-glucosamine dehydrogenase [Gaiellales bacterium]
MPSDIAIIGAGYVGLPLAVAFAEAGQPVHCIDLDHSKVAAIQAGESHIEDVPSARLAPMVEAGSLTAGSDYSAVAGTDAIVICVPTPLSENREPDVSIIRSAAEAIAPHLRQGHLVVLESTTYPGTTRELLREILERGGLVAGRDFHLAMSPERTDPGRTDHTLRTTPKVVGGLTPECTQRAIELYSRSIDTLVPVSSPDAAEMAKLLENIFRSVNIALVNELAMLCDRMRLDVWEVIDAAATKPYGFMRFTPGPGLGGHCIPIDPFYLSWRARQFDFQTEFIELAGKVNTHMPYFCAERVARALNDVRKPVSGSRVLVLGVSYKADVGDVRESPAIKLIELLHGLGADLSYHDPHVDRIEAGGLSLASAGLDDAALAAADLVCVVTPHSSVDYGRVADLAQLVLDFRNVVPRTNGKVEPL